MLGTLASLQLRVASSALPGEDSAMTWITRSALSCGPGRSSHETRPASRLSVLAKRRGVSAPAWWYYFSYSFRPERYSAFGLFVLCVTERAHVPS